MKETIKTTPLKHKQVYDAICCAILDGRYTAGQKIPTEKELAVEFNVSTPTIGRAMRDLEWRGLVVRRQGSGTFVKKTSHVRGQTIGILTSWQGGDTMDPSTTVFGSMVAEISRFAGQKGYSLLLNESSAGNAEDVTVRARTICQKLIELQVAGVFFMPIDDPQCTDNLNLEIAESFDRAGIAVVLLDRDINAWSRRSKFDVVTVNNEYASYMLTNHLLKLGRRRIDFLTDITGITSVADRITGFKRAMAEADADRGSYRVVQIEPKKLVLLDTDEEIAEFDQIAARIRDRQTEAIVCVNDYTAIRLMRRFASIGVSVPNDVSVVGFDDLPVDTLLPVPLTTIRQDPKTLASEAVRTILDRIDNPDTLARDIMVATTLVVRGSCGASNS